MFFLSPTGAVLTSEMAVDGDSKYKYYYYFSKKTDDKPETPVVIQSIRVDTQGVEYPAPEKGADR